MDVINRPALGEDYRLGALYDARTDCFLSTSSLPGGPPPDASRVEWQEGKTIRLCDSADQRAKFNALNIPAPLAASCLAGWVSLPRSGEFLKPSGPSKEDELYYALNFSRSTISQELCLEYEGIRESIENATLVHESSATHVVTQILWGASCTVTASGHVPDQSQRQDIAERFREATRKLEKFKNTELELRTVLKIADDVLSPWLSSHCYSDLISSGAQPPKSLPQIKEHFEKIFDLADLGYAEAQPLSYVLTPVHSIFGHSPYAQLGLDKVGQLSSAHFEQALGLYDSFGNARHLLEDYYKRLKKVRT